MTDGRMCGLGHLKGSLEWPRPYILLKHKWKREQVKDQYMIDLQIVTDRNGEVIMKRKLNISHIKGIISMKGLLKTLHLLKSVIPNISASSTLFVETICRKFTKKLTAETKASLLHWSQLHCGKGMRYFIKHNQFQEWEKLLQIKTLSCKLCC